MKLHLSLVAVAVLLGACRGDQNDKALGEDRDRDQHGQVAPSQPTSPDQSTAPQADPNAVNGRGLDQGQDPGAQDVPGARNPGGLGGTQPGDQTTTPNKPGGQGVNHGPDAVDAGANGVAPPPPNQPGSRPSQRDATQMPGEIPRRSSPAQQQQNRTNNLPR